MQLSNRLFFEQVEAMLAEGHEVQIRMKGHSMRPLLRSERDIAVLTPIARYTGNSEAAAAARKQNRLARNETSPDYNRVDCQKVMHYNLDLKAAEEKTE